MKICIFTENFHKGGLDTFLINLINAWANAGDDFYISCNSNHPGLDTIKKKMRKPVSYILYDRFFTSNLAKGLGDNYYIARLMLRAIIVFFYRLLQYPVLSPWYIFSLYIFFRKSNFDRLMVVNGGYPASLLCRCAVIAWAIYKPDHKAVFNFHNSLGKLRWWNYICENIIDYLVLICSKKIISVSGNTANSIRKKLAFSGAKNIDWVYNGIEDPVNLTKKSCSDINNGKKFLLMLGTFEKRKGHNFLIKAFGALTKDFPELFLLIHGYGGSKEKKAITDCINENSLADRVLCNDFLDNPFDLIASAEILIVPSQEYESFGLTIIEAMALRTPIIATNIGGIPEVLGDSKAGVLIEPSDERGLCVHIKKILRDEVYARQMGENGRKVFLEKFTAKQMSSQYQKIL